MDSDPLVALFAKRPAPGHVKTRLCPPLTPEAAAGLAEAMLRDAVERFSRAGAPPFRIQFAPSAERSWFADAFPGVALAPQVGADLGARLAAFFEAEAPAVAIGGDQPLLTPGLAREAGARLADGVDLVLSPDRGGGYALVGLARPCPELFTEVRMSSAGMLDATLALAHERGLVVEQLAPTDDVDTIGDVERVARALAGLDPASPDYPRRTVDELRALGVSAGEARP